MSDDEQRVLHYSSWMLFDKKGTVVFLSIVALSVGIVLWQSTGYFLLGATAFGLLISSIWRNFVPVYFEINANGIVRWTFGRKKFISWEEIRSYQVQTGGILMYPHADRFPLEPFRGFFLPVPDLLREDIHHRFVFFVDRIVE